MTKYNIYNKGNEKLFKDIAAKYNVDEVISRIIVNRDIPSDKIEEYLNPDINKLYNPFLLKDIEAAAILTQQSVLNNKKIRIIGDYDIDGVMSTYVLLKGLRMLDADVDYQIPHRIEDGYGLNVNIINRAIEDNVDLIITCDNGVSAISEIALARENGIDVIITDHHELMFEEVNGVKTEVLPDANYIINPKRKGDKYPCKKLCGATVAWKFITVLMDISNMILRLSRTSEYMRLEDDSSCNLDNNKDFRPVMLFLENVAFATIGDVMELVDENRIIVKYGLKAMEETENKGLKCLINNRLGEYATILPYHIGFVLGPCINASGRLDSASKSLELLLCEDDNKASQISSELVNLNDDRKNKTNEGVDKAFAIIEKEYKDDKVLVVFIPDIHESIAGIVAGRVREKYSKPAIILCQGEECVKGSGRSIENYNMYEGLHSCRELFIKFGGHPMAAGMSLPIENVDVLRKRLNEECSLTEDELVDVETIDLTINPDYIDVELVRQLELLEPFGNGNKKPLFAHKNTPLHSIRRIGQDGKFFKMELITASGVVTGLYFKDADEVEKRIIDKYGIDEYNKALGSQKNNIGLTIMFYPQINEYKGRRTIQLVLSDITC